MDSTHKFHVTNWWHWVVGPLALLWLIMRSGADPKRLTYPCQQAVMPVAASWLLATAAFFAGSLLLKRVAKVGSALMVMLGVIWLIAGTPDISQSRERGWYRSTVDPPPIWEVANPISKVVVLDEIAPSLVSLAPADASVPVDNLSDATMDELFDAMTVEGIHLYRTTEHPNGIVGADNVVIIKGNYQWTAQNTTSNDRVKGLIWRILNHPDGFTGEIIVADNTQDLGTGINNGDNNSEDPQQSIGDVVNTFYAKGYPVYLLDWFDYFYDVADEYDQGDYSDGYLYDPATHVTYPKFLSPSGGYYISAGKGIWEPESETYDHERLCIINFPVLKAHFLGGASVAVKNWVGMGTISYHNERYGGLGPLHAGFYFSSYALVARIMEATYPRLNIVDATWTTCDGPNFLDTLVRTNIIMASTDPVAVSWYSAKHILTPVALYPSDQTDPDDNGSLYHQSLTNWRNYFVDEAALPCTMDSTEITVTDGGVNFHADTVQGWAPLEVHFEGTSQLSVDNWNWEFGDGEVASSQSVSHTYTDGGIYDVGLAIDAGEDSRVRTRRHYIAVLADTLLADSVKLVEIQDVEMVISGVNATPLDKITIPVEFSGSLDLQYDSFSVAGCRTEAFSDISLIHLSPSTKRLTALLMAPADGYPGVQPGSGPLLKLYFHINGSPSIGDAAEIVLDGYEVSGNNRLPVFSGILAEYQPTTSAGLVLMGDCCDGIRGNVDSDPADIIDISDLVYLVDFMFTDGAEPLCWKEANIDGDLTGDAFKQVDIADLVYLVDYMFNSGAEPPSCPEER